MKLLSVKLGVVLVMGVAIFGYAKVWGANWKYIGEAYDGRYYYDVRFKTRPSEGIVRVWIKVFYGKDGVNHMVKLLGEKYETLSYAMFLFDCHCGDKSKQIVPITFYSKDGKVLISADNPPPDWNFITPDSIDEALYKIVCEQPK